MKKMIAIAAVAMLTLASCKKDYTCECTVLGTTEPTVISKTTKSDATSKCNQANDEVKALGGSCTLK